MNSFNKKLLYVSIFLGLINFLFISPKNPIKVVKKTDFVDFAPNNFYFKLNVIKTKHENNRLLYIAKNGEMKFRPSLFVGDSVLDFDYKTIGKIEGVSWEIVRESIEIEFSAEKIIPIGHQVYIILNSNK